MTAGPSPRVRRAVLLLEVLYGMVGAIPQTQGTGNREPGTGNPSPAVLPVRGTIPAGAGKKIQ